MKRVLKFVRFSGKLRAADTNITTTSLSRAAAFPRGMTGYLLASDPAHEALNLPPVAQTLRGQRLPRHVLLCFPQNTLTFRHTHTWLEQRILSVSWSEKFYLSCSIFGENVNTSAFNEKICFYLHCKIRQTKDKLTDWQLLKLYRYTVKRYDFFSSLNRNE